MIELFVTQYKIGLFVCCLIIRILIYAFLICLLKITKWFEVQYLYETRYTCISSEPDPTFGFTLELFPVLKPKYLVGKR